METLLTLGTSAASTGIIKIGQDYRLNPPAAPVTLMLTGTIAGAEKVEIQYPNGSGWTTLKVGGDEYTLTTNTNIRTLYGPLEFRLLKSATAATVGVQMTDTWGR